MMAKKLRQAAVLTAALLSVSSMNTLAAENVTIPTQTMDPAIHAKLPADIQKSGVMTSVNNGHSLRMKSSPAQTVWTVQAPIWHTRWPKC